PTSTSLATSTQGDDPMDSGTSGSIRAGGSAPGASGVGLMAVPGSNSPRTAFAAAAGATAGGAGPPGIGGLPASPRTQQVLLGQLLNISGAQGEFSKMSISE
ncbi:hypothetical protein HK102_004259, partial [Quaeritorhiza haematococci]